MTQYLVFGLLWITYSAGEYDYQDEENCTTVTECYSTGPEYYSSVSEYSTVSEHYSTVTGIAAYRSALTLDWLADEDSRQREYAHVFENDKPMLRQEPESSECMEYSRPAPGKVARLMLELLKNLEGDDGIIQDLAHTLIRTKLLVRTSHMEAEPDLSSLVQTPQLVQGEPHVTLPRVLAVVWVLASDPATVKENGWCYIEKLTQYLDSATPAEIALRMRAIDPIIARARYIVEDFMQSTTPLNVKRQLRPLELRAKLKKDNKLRHRHLHTSTPISPVRHWDPKRPTRTEPVTTSPGVFVTTYVTDTRSETETTQRVIQLPYVTPLRHTNGAVVARTSVSVVLSLFVLC